ncbi:MAG: flagellar protein export ATPase FliI [Rickettsiales bacterium]
MSLKIKNLVNEVDSLPDYKVFGKVSAVKGLLLEAIGISYFTSVGSFCHIRSRSGDTIRAEVVGFRDNITLLMAFDNLLGIGTGCEVEVVAKDQAIYPSPSWLGRVVNAFGEPIDDKGALHKGDQAYFLHSLAPPAKKRRRVAGKLDMGVRAVNAFTTCCKGQRLGIMAGSGVGKSMMMAMFTKFANTDVKIIGLIGERGREVQEFIEDYLGEEGLKHAVVVVATSDEAALARKQAAYLMMTIAEYFRDQGKEVLAMMDNVTRFAMAQREIGLAAGEPPTTKGYTPSVFAELPRLLERSGPGLPEQGDITGIFAVLVEGDDTNEPIADALRAILDGHIDLDREIAARGRYPAINIMKSVSRLIPSCNTPEENALILKAKKYLATYENMADMVRIGAYKAGSDPEVDLAIRYFPAIENFLEQDFKTPDSLENAYLKLAAAIDFKN